MKSEIYQKEHSTVNAPGAGALCRSSREKIWKKPCQLSPSLISCLDMCNLERDVRLLEKAGIEMLHIDLLDGHFSPSMPLGLDAVRQLKKITGLAFDVHVMTTKNEYFVEELIDIGVEQIVFHVETEAHVDGMLNRIRSAGIRSGVALKPGTPLSAVDYIIDQCDSVLLMLINPGYASSSKENQVSYARRKIQGLRELIDGRELNTQIELDGRISADDIRSYGCGTADIFVAGSTCLSKGELAESIGNLQELRTQVLGEGGRRQNGSL